MENVDIDRARFVCNEYLKDFKDWGKWLTIKDGVTLGDYNGNFTLQEIYKGRHEYIFIYSFESFEKGEILECFIDIIILYGEPSYDNLQTSLSLLYETGLTDFIDRLGLKKVYCK